MYLCSTFLVSRSVNVVNKRKANAQSKTDTRYKWHWHSLQTERGRSKDKNKIKTHTPSPRSMGSRFYESEVKVDRYRALSLPVWQAQDALQNTAPSSQLG